MGLVEHTGSALPDLGGSVTKMNINPPKNSPRAVNPNQSPLVMSLPLINNLVGAVETYRVLVA